MSFLIWLLLGSNQSWVLELEKILKNIKSVYQVTSLSQYEYEPSFEVKFPHKVIFNALLLERKIRLGCCKFLHSPRKIEAVSSFIINFDCTRIRPNKSRSLLVQPSGPTASLHGRILENLCWSLPHRKAQLAFLVRSESAAPGTESSLIHTLMKGRNRPLRSFHLLATSIWPYLWVDLKISSKTFPAAKGSRWWFSDRRTSRTPTFSRPQRELLSDDLDNQRAWTHSTAKAW